MGQGPGKKRQEPERLAAVKEREPGEAPLALAWMIPELEHDGLYYPVRVLQVGLEQNFRFVSCNYLPSKGSAVSDQWIQQQHLRHG